MNDAILTALRGPRVPRGLPLQRAAPALAPATTVLARGVPPGVYAVQAYHDRNDDHAVDRNVFGLPTEAVEFSNDAPRVKSWAFHDAGAGQTIISRLRHFAGSRRP
jgi:uncharacterized protein (DUF2141 family)